MVTIDAGGRASFLQYTAKPDGGDYSEHDVITLAQQQMSDRKTPNTYSESRIDEYTVAWADKRDGETYLSGTKRVTADGMQLIIDFSAPDADGELVDYSLVYDKQSP